MRQISRAYARTHTRRSSNPKSGNILPLVAIFIVLFIFLLNVDLSSDDLKSIIGGTAGTAGTSSSANVLFGPRDGQGLIPDYELIPEEAPSFYTNTNVADDFTASFANQEYDFVSDFERAAPSFYTSGDGVDQDFIDDFQDAGFTSNDEYVSGYAMPNEDYIQDWWGNGVSYRELR